MLARVSPRNAASTFGASIEQALQGVESRVKRLEDQPAVAQLEEAIRSAEARLQRLERDRDGQAKLIERVESLIASRVRDLRQNVDRSLEVIIEKVKGEVESLRGDLATRDAQLRKDFGAEVDAMRDLRRQVDAVADLDARFQAEVKATRDVCMATTVQVGAVEDSLGQVRATVQQLPPFLWGLTLDGAPHRRHILAEPPSRPRHPTPTAARQSAARQRPEPDALTLSEGGHFSPRGGAFGEDADGGLHDGAGGADTSRRRTDRSSHRDSLTVAGLAGEALMGRAAMASTSRRSGSVEKAAAEALMDASGY